MKELPDIAPEIRGLMEEIVADPRSAIRLAPKKALRSWFESDETVRAREISTTRAERHLLEAHKDALAQLLCEAAIIAYWKAPVLVQRPIGSDGKPWNPASEEPVWRLRAQRKVGMSSLSQGVELLQSCLKEIRPEQGWSMAQASLSMAPSDRTRCYCAVNVPWSRPRAAIALFQRLAHRARPKSLRPTILLGLGARLCSTGRHAEAREAYRTSSRLDPTVPFGWFYSFNLSCVLGDERSAITEAAELAKRVGESDARVAEAARVILEWTKTAKESELAVARSVARRISLKIPEAASALCRALEA